MATVVAKNKKLFDIMIEDLGISVPRSSQIELVGKEGVFNIFEVAVSTKLKGLVKSGDIIINDGIIDLSIQDGIRHLTLVTKYEKGV